MQASSIFFTRFKTIDTNGDGYVDWREFVAFVPEAYSAALEAVEPAEEEGLLSKVSGFFSGLFSSADAEDVAVSSNMPDVTQAKPLDLVSMEALFKK